MRPTGTRQILLSLLSVMFLLLLPVTAQAAPAADEEIQVLENGVHVQTYLPPDRSLEKEHHTIYWVKGVQPPKMSHEVSNYGTEGYFSREQVRPGIGYYSYQQAFPYQGDNPADYIQTGYWDINKTNKLANDQKDLCYMATATNLLHWWVEQNRPYILQYKEKIEQGEMQQEKGLLPLTGAVLDTVLAPPPMVKDHMQEGYDVWMQTIPSSPISKEFLHPVYKGRKAGGWMDNVIGFFLNGYSSANQSARPVPDKFVPDPKGGIFHPVFGTTPLAIRYELQTAEFYNTKFKEWILDGKAIGISYKPSGTHAVTLWGVEYDEYGNICRIFISDSDDATFPISQQKVNGAPVSRALYSFDVEIQANTMYLTADHSKKMPMDGAVEFSLGQEIWESVLTDPNPTPQAPVDLITPPDQTYGSGAHADPLAVTASLDPRDADKGAFLSYQWYQGPTAEGPWEPLPGKTGSSFVPTIGSEPGTIYYRCEVTSHKYGNLAAAQSRPIAVTTTAEPARDAETPQFQSIDPKILDCKQWKTPPAVTVNASVSDGGTLYYQWFYEDNGTIDETRPVGEPTTSNQFFPPTDEAGTHLYFCIITNQNPNATGRRSASLDLLNKKGAFLTVNVAPGKPAPNCTVTFATPGATAVKSKTVPGGAKLELPDAPTRPGYQFTGWYLDEALTRPMPVDYVITRDVTLYAGWRLEGDARGLEYRITGITLPGGRLPAGEFKVEVSVTNLASALADQLVVAAYDAHGRMVSAATQLLDPSGTNAGAELPPISVQLRSDGTAARVKAYILSGSGGTVPLSASFSAGRE